MANGKKLTIYKRISVTKRVFVQFTTAFEQSHARWKMRVILIYGNTLLLKDLLHKSLLFPDKPAGFVVVFLQ